MSSIARGCDCSSVMGAGDIGVITLKGLLGRFKSLRLKGIDDCCSPLPENMLGSFESDSIVTICGSQFSTDEIVITLRANAPDNAVSG